MANNDGDNTGDDSKPSKKRARVTQSCNTCRKRRVKCSGNEPVCEPCAVKQLQCSWTAPKRRGPVPGRNLQARALRLCTHLYDLFQVVPGLETISEVLLGLRELQSASAMPTALHVRLPHNIEEVTESMPSSSKQAVFRATRVGKYFDEDVGDIGEDSPVQSSANEATFPLVATASTPISSRQQHFSLPPLPPTAFQAHPGNVSLEDILSQFNGGNTSFPGNGNVFDAYQKPTLATADGADLSDLQSRSQQPNAHAANLAPTEAEEEDMLPHRYIWGNVSAADGNIPCLFGATSGLVDVGKPLNIKITTMINASVAPLDTDTFLTTGTQTKLFDIYLNVIHPYLPMCSRLDLMRWSHEPLPTVASNQRHRTLMMAILACALPYLPPNPDTDLPRQTAILRRQARAELADELGKPSLYTLQALLLLSLADWGAGELAVAWAGLAQTIGLAVHLGLQVPPTESTNLDNSAYSRLLTWYCIVVLDVALASQLGRWPLCPGVTAVLELPSNGYDEWDSWKIGARSKLEILYNNDIGADPHGSADEVVIPGHIHSIFSQAVSVARIGQRVLTIANAIERSRSDVLALQESLQDLEDLRESLARPTDHLSPVTQTPQHGLDVSLACLYWRIIIYRELAAINDSSIAEYHQAVQESRKLIELRIQAHTFYRAAAPCLHMLYTVASIADDNSDLKPPPEVSALKQMQKIYPAYTAALLDVIPQKHEVRRRGSLTASNGTLPNIPQNLSSLPLPYSPVSVSSLSGQFVPPMFAGFPNVSGQNQMQGSFPQRIESIMPTYGTLTENVGNSRTSPLRESQASGQTAGALTFTPNTYSLPDQAFAAMLGDDSLDRQKAFDAATWEQTDVLTALGAFNLPLDNSLSTDVFALSGILDRWSSGDGDLWSRTSL